MKYRISKGDDLQDRLRNRLNIGLESRLFSRLNVRVWNRLQVLLDSRLKTRSLGRLWNRLQNYYEV